MFRRIVKITLCLAGLFLFIISAACLHVITVFIPGKKWRAFSRLNKYFARFLTMIAGVRCVVHGREHVPRSPGFLLISNHVTYLDGVLLGSIFPVIYLSKSAIKRWPLVNWMATISGTIFVDRIRKSAAATTVDEMAARMKHQANVLLFPEGTSTNADVLKKFQSVFFAAPLVCKAPLVPVVIRYRAIDRQPVTRLNRHRIFWWGQNSFHDHLSQLLYSKAIEAEIQILPAIESAAFQDSSEGRKALAQHAHDIINAQYPLL